MNQLSRNKQGASLATVMMVVALMMMLAFTVVAIAFNHLNLSFKNQNSSQARHLAEATLAMAIDKIVKDNEYGLYGTPEEKTVTLTLSGLSEGNQGVLTFDESEASDLGLPCSTNNRSESSRPGNNDKMVPGESYHLVARGQVKNSRYLAEAIITIPKFPFSVAAEGAIKSNGGLTVASVKKGIPYDLRYPIHEDDLEPGHLVSNSGAGDEAIVLSGENKIYGDLQSFSGVTIEEDTSILGEIRTNANAEELPKTEASDYDPELEPGLNEVNSGAGQLELEGYNKSRRSLTVDNGIRLNGGVLFVKGDLTVSAGGVSGRGALISTGNMTIYGDGEAASDNQAALIADGDIVLVGASSDKARYRGLIYTNSRLRASNLRLAGVFVAAGDDSEVEFQNVEVYEDQDAAMVSIKEQVGFSLPPAVPPSHSPYGVAIEASYDTTNLQARIEDYRNPATGPGQPDFLFKTANQYSSTGFFTYEYDTDGNAVLKETSGPDQYVIDGEDLGLKLFGHTITSLSQAETVLLNEVEARKIANGDGPLTSSEADTVRGLAKTYWNNGSVSLNMSYTAVQYTTTESETTGTGFEWSIDRSDFYSGSNPLRQVYWAEYK